jgi:hypothetical protein
MKTPATPFNLLLTQPERDMLRQLSELRNHSRGQVLRDLIKAAHQMQLQNYPVCATGQPCYMPQIHVGRVSPPKE